MDDAAVYRGCFEVIQIHAERSGPWDRDRLCDRETGLSTTGDMVCECIDDDAGETGTPSTWATSDLAVPGLALPVESRSIWSRV